MRPLVSTTIKDSAGAPCGPALVLDTTLVGNGLECRVFLASTGEPIASFALDYHRGKLQLVIDQHGPENTDESTRVTLSSLSLPASGEKVAD